MKKVVGFLNSARLGIARLWAHAMCLAMLCASGAAFAQTTGFTDRVGSATVRDSADMLARTKTGVDNYQTIITLVLMIIGFGIMAWGVFWVMSAARSEGRTEAKPGWIMIAGGGALGAATVIYILLAGVFTAAAT